MTSVVAACLPGAGGDVLGSWAEHLAGRAGDDARGCLRFAFYGRVPAEDWQDPVTSRARQLQQAAMLVSGHGVIAAEFFDAGESRMLPWARRPQAAALVAQLAIRGGGGTRWGSGSTSGRSAAAGTPRWPRCSSTTRSACGGRRSAAGRLARRGSRADDGGAGPVVQAGDHPDPGPGADRDGGADAGAGPVPGRPPAVRVPARRCRARTRTRRTRRGGGGRTGWSPIR